jgi:hypothetical protein
MHNKRSGIPKLLVLFVVIAFAVSSCTAISNTVSKAKSSINRRAENAILSATGIAGLQDSMLAMVVYTHAFFAGGFMYGYENFNEGEGVKWRIQVSTDDEESRLTVERALLKRNEDGSGWWQLRYSDNESDLLSEALIGKEYELLAFRYRDQESGEIREWLPEQNETSDQEDAEEEEPPEYYQGPWESHVVGTSVIQVPAGTFNAQEVLLEEKTESHYTDEAGNDQTKTGILRYQWWISDEIPGKLVKYRWEDSSEGSVFTGELISNKTGYKTQLSSF